MSSKSTWSPQRSFINAFDFGPWIWTGLTSISFISTLNLPSADGRFNVDINEIDVSPVQIQGPKSKALMKDLCGDQVDFDDMPFYGLAAAKVGGRDVIISQSGFSGEAGYEIYLRDSTLYAEDMWNAVLDKGKAHNLMVIAITIKLCALPLSRTAFHISSAYRVESLR